VETNINSGPHMDQSRSGLGLACMFSVDLGILRGQSVIQFQQLTRSMTVWCMLNRKRVASIRKSLA
jgi:hypothetical protein